MLHLKLCDEVLVICKPLTTVHSTCIFLVLSLFYTYKK